MILLLLSKHITNVATLTKISCLQSLYVLLTTESRWGKKKKSSIYHSSWKQISPKRWQGQSMHGGSMPTRLCYWQCWHHPWKKRNTGKLKITSQTICQQPPATN